MYIIIIARYPSLGSKIEECDTGIVRSLPLSDFRQNSLAGELGSQAIIIYRERDLCFEHENANSLYV